MIESTAYLARPNIRAFISARATCLRIAVCTLYDCLQTLGLRHTEGDEFAPLSQEGRPIGGKRQCPIERPPLGRCA